LLTDFTNFASKSLYQVISFAFLYTTLSTRKQLVSLLISLHLRTIFFLQTLVAQGLGSIISASTQRCNGLTAYCSAPEALPAIMAKEFWCIRLGLILIFLHNFEFEI